ncbi:MAG: type I restriction enzyme HsdR N-terminal domain-containing protein [Holophagales bacterium]|jgi:hypothetical protein|nr:type I restriction enzyme HsdR N-terminal domain-containing protein [Holophagales bacterium]
MDFSEKIKALADRAQKVKTSLNTEEATKTALVMPFIQALGYDVFNPLEVVPEYVADVAGRKGEKVDYAIVQDGNPIMIIECKACGTNLNAINREQLHRYFLTVESCIGILTDGLRYQFFSHGDDGKNMDVSPFMEFDIENIDPTLLPELRKLCKGKFDLKNTLDTVCELKFNRQVKLALASNLEGPDMDFVDYLMTKAGLKGLRQKTKEDRYLPYTKRAFNEFIAEQVDSRLKSALAASSKKEDEPPLQAAPPAVIDIITENEWQALYLVKSILMGIIDTDRVTLRDLAGTGRSQVIMDNTRTKPLVFLEFQNADKLIAEIVSSVQSKERQSVLIAKVEDLLQHSETIRAIARAYAAGKTTETS